MNDKIEIDRADLKWLIGMADGTVPPADNFLGRLRDLLKPPRCGWCIESSSVRMIRCYLAKGHQGIHEVNPQLWVEL